MGQESVSGIENLSYLNQDNEIKPVEVRSQRDPTTSDRRYKKGTIWVNEVGNHVFLLTSVNNAVPNWEPLSQSAGGNAPVTKYVVDADGSGDYTTIQAALDAANLAGGGIVVVREGAYTENLTLYDKTEVVSISDSQAENVKITGIHTPPTSGSFSFKNIFLVSATSIISSAAVGSARLTLQNCLIDITAGYSFNVPNWTGELIIKDCNTLGSVSDGVIINTSGSSTIIIINSVLGASSTPLAMTVNNGGAFIYWSRINTKIETYGNGALFSLGSLFLSTSSPAMSTADNSTVDLNNCYLESQSASAFFQNSAQRSKLVNCIIETSTSPAINGNAGKGDFYYGNLQFLSDDTISSNVSLVGIPSKAGEIVFPDGEGISMEEGGANARIGLATLVAGTVTVNTTAVTANSRIQVTPQGVLLGAVYVTNKVVGTSFDIVSTNVADTPLVAWEITEAV